MKSETLSETAEFPVTTEISAKDFDDLEFQIENIENSTTDLNIMSDELKNKTIEISTQKVIKNKPVLKKVKPMTLVPKTLEQ